MEIITETVVDRHPADVFALLADYRRDGEWRSAVVTMDVAPDAPVTVGSRITETLRFAGQTHVTVTTVTALTPGAHLAFEGANASAVVRGSRSVARAGAGARVTQRLELLPRGSMRLLAPVLRPLYRRVAARDLAALRTLLERPAVPA